METQTGGKKYKWDVDLKRLEEISKEIRRLESKEAKEFGYGSKFINRTEEYPA